MKVMVPFLIVRKNHEVIVAEPLNDEYTPVQLLIPKFELTEWETNVLVNCDSANVGQDSIYFCEHEAKDYHINYPWLKVGIEYVGVDVL